MRTVSVGDVQKNFARIFDSIQSGERVVVTRQGRPVAQLTALGPQGDVRWPDFLAEAVDLPGTPVSKLLDRQREERF